MKKYKTIQLLAVILIAIPVCFTACIKDDCSTVNTYTYFKPVYKTRDAVRNNIRSNSPREIVNAGKLYVKGQYIFLNEVDRGIHVIDNSNPSDPKNIAFIDIPGNMELAVKGNMLYADLYTDMVAIDITNPSNVIVKKFVENLFPYRSWGFGFQAADTMIISDWQRIDTTIKESCDNPGWVSLQFESDVFFNGSIASAATSPFGVGGSMARFAVLAERLYTVTRSDLDVFNISNLADPAHTNRVNIGWDIETIYPFQNKLFIGSNTGMYIYNVSNPDQPMQTGQFHHIRTCDPVIADNQYAYVTLSAGTTCPGNANELNILKLNNFTNPELVKVYNMSNPKGLAKDGNFLFICDGGAGLKVYNASDVHNLQHIKTIQGINPFDIITLNGVALVVAADGLYQYDYSNINDIRLLSKITTN
jgi:hypothetical protein